MTATSCGTLTRLGTGDELDRVGLFEGFVPSECKNGVDDDGDGEIDENDIGCQVKDSTSERGPKNLPTVVRNRASVRSCRIRGTLRVASDLPERAAELRKVRVRVSGPGRYRRTITQDLKYHDGENWSTARLTRGGRYTIATQYLGDRYRKTSKVTRSRVRVAMSCSTRR